MFMALTFINNTPKRLEFDTYTVLLLSIGYMEPEALLAQKKQEGDWLII